MFTKEERLFIWKKVYEMIDRLEDGEYICVALRNVVFMYFKKHKNIYGLYLDKMVKIYFPELEEKISMATEPEETRTFYGWREDRHAYFCIIEGMTRRAGAYVPVLVRFWASHKQ